MCASARAPPTHTSRFAVLRMLKPDALLSIEADLPQGTVPLVPVSSRADQGEDVVASGRRCGIQRGKNHPGLSAITQPRPSRSFAMKGPA